MASFLCSALVCRMGSHPRSAMCCAQRSALFSPPFLSPHQPGGAALTHAGSGASWGLLGIAECAPASIQRWL